MSIPMDHNIDDPWALQPDEASGFRSDPGQFALQIKTIKDVEPLNAQIGTFPKKTVPDALYDTLFGQSGSTGTETEAVVDGPPVMRTYAILDAAKVINLPEVLEDSGLEHRCLFRGTAYDELKNVAPWIVRLEEDSNFTRNLFTSSNAPWHYWETEPGFYIRSRGTLDEMCGHFRKFVKIRDTDGAWFYFRFWEPAALPAYLSGLSDRPLLALRWFSGRVGVDINAMLFPSCRNSTLTLVSPAELPDNRPAVPIHFTAYDRDAIAAARTKVRLSELSDLLAKTFPELLDRDEQKLGFLVHRTVSRMQQFGPPTFKPRWPDTMGIC